MSLTEYHQEIIAFYNARTNYDDNDLTYRRAIPLVELAQLQRGQSILDIATGTAIIAIAAAEKVGVEGKVIGVDFCPGMLAQAKRKIETAKLSNIELIEADVETINFEEESFDAIFCSSAIVLFTDIPKIIKNWYRFLKKGGIVAFSCSSETSFFTPVIMQVCAKYNLDLPNLHKPLGTPERCYSLMQEIGFEDIDINMQEFGSYLTLEDAQNYWQGKWLHLLNPLRNLSDEKIEQLKTEFRTQVTALATDQGVWDEYNAFFVISHKF